MKILKRKKIKKLESFLEKLDTLNYPKGYLLHHKDKIECLRWLLSYYKGQISTTPEEFLNMLITPNEIQKIKNDKNCGWIIDWIFVLYHWVYNKKIIGF